jgi:hypothetical protein
MAKVLCVLYDDPADGYPPTYARDEIPAVPFQHRVADRLPVEPGDTHSSASHR